MSWAELGGAGLPQSLALPALFVCLAGLAAWQLCRGRQVVPGLPYGVYEKRRCPRHACKVISLRLADADGQTKPYTAQVLDYSREGLCLAVQEPPTVGAILRLRPEQANADDSWVSVWVRHCRRSADRWEVGCRNLQPLAPLLEAYVHGNQTA